MTLSLRQLRFFVAAAEAGTIAGAAAREHISQSTIAASRAGAPCWYITLANW